MENKFSDTLEATSFTEWRTAREIDIIRLKGKGLSIINADGAGVSTHMRLYLIPQGYCEADQDRVITGGPSKKYRRLK
jgi:hypothetical protein